MKKSFYETGGLNELPCVKTPLRSFASINIENDDEYCFMWSILAALHPCSIKLSGWSIKLQTII